MIKSSKGIYFIFHFFLSWGLIACVPLAHAAGGLNVGLIKQNEITNSDLPIRVAQLTLDRMIRLAPQAPSMTEGASKPADAASAVPIDMPADGGLAQPVAEVIKPVALTFKKNQRADLVFRDFLKANKMSLDWRYPFYVIVDEEATFEGANVREVITKALAALGLRATLDGGRTVIVDQRF